MTATRAADVIVVGLGAMGSATCFQLAARGASVIGFDRYHPPHPYGSTHGDTRITRLAIGEGPEFVPLVQRSHVLWREIERQSGTQLLTQTGGLILGHAGNPFLSQTRASARKYGIAHEMLLAPQIADRFPMFAIDAETEGYYEPESGYLRPEAAVEAQLELARGLGAVLAVGTAVDGWSPTGEGVTVRAGTETYSADRLVLCVGPWVGHLFPEGREMFAVYRQLLYWFEIRRGYEQLRDMPAYVWDYSSEKRELVHLVGFYGFPAIDGPGGGLKVATESYAETTDPDGQQHPATEAEVDEMYSNYLAPRMPWLGSTALRSVSCLYTSTRSNRFVIDRHPCHESVLIVSACSGHGFKHSPAIGEAVAQLLTAGSSEIDLRPFTIADAAGHPGR
jgi:sarcosine oxidase